MVTDHLKLQSLQKARVKQRNFKLKLRRLAKEIDQLPTKNIGKALSQQIVDLLDEFKNDTPQINKEDLKVLNRLQEIDSLIQKKAKKTKLKRSQSANYHQVSRKVKKNKKGKK